jgi:predicted ribosome quality control (RQC) complex YloA/Tae2 family protein
VYCDALTLAAVVEELRRELLGGRVQRVLLVDRWVIGLEVYASRRHYLLVSARPQEGGRIHLVQDKLRRGVDSPSPLLLRLRKEVEGSRLVQMQQLPLERVLRLTTLGPEGTRTLVVEIMGQRSNVVLLEEDGTILECARRVAATQNRYRVLLPGQPYVAPPPQKKANGLTLTPTALNELLNAQDSALPLWERLVASVLAVSPLLAREVVHRATGDAQSMQADGAVVLQHLQALLGLATSGQWQPSVALEGDRIVAYAPYVLTQSTQHEPRASISSAMEAFYSHWVGEEGYAAAKASVQNLIEQQRERQRHKRKALLAANPATEVLERLRKKGELLLAYAHEVAPGQAKLSAQWSEEEPAICIELDPTLSAVENARDYFRRYEKARSATAEVPGLLAHVDGELAYLEQLTTDLALAEDRPSIDAVTSALSEAGYIPRPKAARQPAAGPRRVSTPEGFIILVGRNSWQNEQLTFHQCDSDDLWLHAKDMPGAHVVIRSPGAAAPETVLQRAAELAAYYSAARQDKRVLVDYTLRRNVRRLPGGKQGQVTYTRQKTIKVTPRRDAADWDEDESTTARV